MIARSSGMISVWCGGLRSKASVCDGCFLDQSSVCRLKRTALSKSSTLTKLHSSECSDMHLRKRVHVKVLSPPRGADRHRQRGFQGKERDSMLLIQDEGADRTSSDAVNDRSFSATLVAGEQSSPSSEAVGHHPVFLFLDQIKREKGVWWMPWQ